MTTLEFFDFKISGCKLGEDSGLPDMNNNLYIHSHITVDGNLTEQERKNIGKGMLDTILPYTDQNQYDRSRNNLSLKAAKLENEYLRAIFITELGGRLWSLYDKKENRELLYANNCFQAGNLGIRNAWFSGGVEWNVGIKGHSMLTCSPLFAAKCVNIDGEPVLSMYEYERKRKIVYSVNAYLNNDVLLIKNIIENKNKDDVYMYWWSNIAVDENTDTRVIAPTNEAFTATYANCSYVIGKTDYPYDTDKDASYASNIPRSKDYFYNIPNDQDKWVCAVNGDGRGLLQFSTPELIGRKLFAWGQKTGGRHWNEWLSDSNKPYIEIQAGLLKTQLEHFIMQKESEISFIEGYTSFKGERSILHDKDYNKAINYVGTKVKELLPVLKKEKFNIKIKDIVYSGSGYGALEEKIRGKRISEYCLFPASSMNENQEYWNSLLNGAEFNIPPVICPIISYSDNLDFINIIEDKKSKTWYDYYQLAVLYYQKKDIKKCKECYEKSFKAEKNPWALRGLMQLAYSEEKNFEKAVSLAFDVIKLKNDHLALCIDAGLILLNCKAYGKYNDLFMLFNKSLQNNGRLKLQYALACAHLGNKKEAEKIIMSLTVFDMKEGEYTLSDLWMLIHAEEGKELSEEEVFEKYKLPRQLDFRMH